MAIRLVEAARAAGADAVKFQTFRAEDVVTPQAVTADYQRSNTGETNQFEMIKKLELDEEAHRAGWRVHCAAHGHRVLLDAFLRGGRRDAGPPGRARLKLPSGEITNRPLLECAADTGLPLADVLGHVDTGRSRARRRSGSPRAGGRRADRRPMQQPDLLHCTSAYPAPADSLNLRAMSTMAGATGLPVGYSDHSEGHRGRACGGRAGRHCHRKALDAGQGIAGPGPLRFRRPGRVCRHGQGHPAVEAMLGDGIKRPAADRGEHPRCGAPQPRDACAISRAGMCWSIRTWRCGVRGPGSRPEQWQRVVGRRLARDLAAHTTLEWAMLAGKG